MTKNAKKVLCFKEGEPFLYDKSTKEYIALDIDVQTSLKLVEEIILKKNYKKRPSMRDIWPMLASTIDDCDSFCNNFSIKNSTNQNCFESIFSIKISDFLNELFPLEQIKEQNKLRREYEKKWSEKYKVNFCYAIERKGRENLMNRKAGKKVY